jgi:hypothetical protein
MTKGDDLGWFLELSIEGGRGFFAGQCELGLLSRGAQGESGF